MSERNQSEEPFGGILDMLGGFQGLIAAALVSLYLSNKDRIGEVADRLLTPNEATVRKVCSALGVKAPSDVARVLEACRAWGDKGGDVLELIAEIKALRATGGGTEDALMAGPGAVPVTPSPSPGTLDSRVRSLERRVRSLERQTGLGSVVDSLISEVQRRRDEFFAANPTENTFGIEVLPGFVQFWDRARLSTPVFTDLKSRLQVNHNLQVIASVDGGVGRLGHAHLNLLINRDDGERQGFQLIAIRDDAGRAALAMHTWEREHDPIHALVRGEEVESVLWVDQDINGRVTASSVPLERRGLVKET